MAFLIVGVLLLAAKAAEFGPFANWSWWIVLAPFLLAALWWEFADGIGLTQRRAIDKMEQRKQDRRDRALDALGLDHRKDRKLRRAREVARNKAANLAGSDARDLHRTEAEALERNERRDPRL